MKWLKKLLGRDTKVEEVTEKVVKKVKEVVKDPVMVDYHYDRNYSILTIEYDTKEVQYKNHGGSTWREVRELKSPADYIEDEPAGMSLHLLNLYETCMEHEKYTIHLTEEEKKLKKRKKTIDNILNND